VRPSAPILIVTGSPIVMCGHDFSVDFVVALPATCSVKHCGFTDVGS
jgi:hypothetical protein